MSLMDMGIFKYYIRPTGTEIDPACACQSQWRI